MDFGDGDGWTTVQEPPHKELNYRDEKMCDKLPFSVTLANLHQKLADSEADFVQFGDYPFTTIITVGVIMEINSEGGKTDYLMHDPEESEKTFHVLQFGNPDDGSTKYIDTNLEEDVRVRIIGKLKNVDGQKSILAYLIQKLANDQDFEIFKLEAKAAALFFEKNVMQKMRNGQGDGWNGMLASPSSRFQPEFVTAKSILSPKTPSLKRRASPSPSATPVTPSTIPPLIPTNPHLRNTPITRNIEIKPEPSTPKPLDASWASASSSGSGSSVNNTPAPKTSNNALRAKIRACIRQEETLVKFEDESHGVTFQKLFHRVGGNVPEERLRTTLRDMEDAGIIYSACEGQYRVLT